MQLFYNPSLTASSQSVQFNKKESGHIIKSLRKIKGDNLHITNGRGFLFSSIITRADPNTCVAKITGYSFQEPLSYYLQLAVAPTKMNRRYEWLLEKATEIGVSKITPVICAHSERRDLKLKRFERVLQSAMKQSLRLYLPQLEEPVSFSKFIGQTHENQKYIAHCAEDKRILFKHEITPKHPITLLIGPEGDFSSQEIDQALQHNFTPVSLGPNRLRTETAAIAGCYTVALANQR